jgi:adenylate cyclase
LADRRVARLHRDILMLQSFRAWVAELRRRRVFSVAAVYAAVSFVIWQAADIAFPALRLPDWTMTLVVVLVLLGFPIALIFAWIFDVTPDGVRVTTPAAGGSRLHSGAVAALAGIALVAISVGAFAMLPRGGGDAERELSIAVLPFANGSDDPANEYLSDGITDAIQSRLNRLGDLWVTSRTSAMSYKGSSKQLRVIGDELGVAYIVEGSVRRTGSRLRISASLVDAGADRTLWSDSYDRELSDVFEVETEIAERIASALRVRLSATQRGRLAIAGTSSTAAYELLLKARNVGEGKVAADYTEVRDRFYQRLSLLRQAVAEDPDYAEAWAELSRAFLAHIDLDRPARRDSAMVMAERAVRARPDLPDGYVARGAVLDDQQDEAAGGQYALALERDPNNVRALTGMVRREWQDMRFLQVGRLLHRAARLDPADANVASSLSSLYRTLGDYGRAEQWLRRSLDRRFATQPYERECDLAQFKAAAGDSAAAAAHVNRYLSQAPDVPFTWSCAANALQEMGDNGRALELWQRFRASLDNSPSERRARAAADFAIGQLLADMGDRDGALLAFASFEPVLQAERALCPVTCSNTPLAVMYAYRGDADQALEYLRLSIGVGWIDVYPGSRWVERRFANISHDSRYRQVMRDLRAHIDAQRELLLREVE